nr:MAG TPA: helix-turn-helix domain protein [Caudoviricetes sp.]
MTVGDYIKELRTSRGYSQEQLGKMLGVQRAAVQKWECGAVQNLKRETIKKLSEVFNVPASSFIDSVCDPAYKPTDEDIKFALFDGADNITDEMYEEVKRFAEALGTSSCYLLDGKETSKDFVSSFALTEREKTLVIAYRNHPDMQKSVDKLLGVEPEEKIYIIKKAARNGDNSPLVVTDSKLKELENLPEVPLEDG